MEHLELLRWQRVGEGEYDTKTVIGNASLKIRSVYGDTSVSPSGTATIRIRASRRPTDGGVVVQLPESANTQSSYVSLEKSVGSGYVAVSGITYHGTDGNQYVVTLSV